MNEPRSSARRTAKIVGAAVVGAIIAVGCGGQSELHSDDGDGTSGGSAGNERGGRGGDTSGTGGTSGVGASPTGGVGASPAGGIGASPTGGVSGTSSGGFAGTSGTSGAGGICSLPLETGSCNAYFPSFGFSQADGNCQPFVYGGCQGNDNRFSTLAECEAKCGGSLSTCPPQAPFNLSCSETGKRCTYDSDDCLCAPKQPYSCTKLDPECVRPGIDGGVSEIIVVLYNLCECRGDSSSAGGTWACNFVSANQ
jgi:hypothetical protein